MNSNAFDIVKVFESEMAHFTGSKYAVAVDTCTAALFLSCRYLHVNEVKIPNKTYCSVPCSIIHAGGRVVFENISWSGIYYLKPYPIIDAACRFRRGMYVKDTYMCLSFQYKKNLPIGRGGMILTNCKRSYEWFKLARFSGRHEVPLMQDTPEMIGWSCYMEPERAAKGLQLLQDIGDGKPDLHFDYPDLSQNKIYKETANDPSNGCDFWR